ncbi:uncharacterized protein FIBRA_06828 [Fibroporia radiculosa]|uniref:D-isomer specific 2-hydroxyacid dehydrogenase NAD-binding domain-containing protein n=1 Tax=Fibroporia radiculosa TaxID=599839 RepID=J4H4A3_9APHY|nr:uncharacterized protein FIBRA_06828 [Fibroporia radiculosa]CCM04644.1 predicted protein [Fibroporia radiculosa]
MQLPRVLICGSLDFALQECKSIFNGTAEVIFMDCSSREELLTEFQPGHDYDGISGIIRHWNAFDITGPFDKEFIECLPSSVKYIASLCAGYEMIDIDACKERGILVSNTPGVGDAATATTALYLMISSLRCFTEGELNIRSGLWRPPSVAKRAHDLEGHTLAIIGLGGIGLRFAEFAHAFPMHVVYHNRHKLPQAPEYCEYFDAEHLDEMLANADVLSVHVPLNKHTERLVDWQMIAKLKRGAVLINTARGRVIDESAMIKALEEGQLSAVGLDVYPDEPHVNPRLLEFPNATLLPHLGGVSFEVQKLQELHALMNLREFLCTGTAPDVVPELRS